MVVPFKHGHLYMSKEEAQKLVRDITIRLERAGIKDSSLNSPHVSGGLMKRDDFYQFFAQKYHKAPLVRSHAGKLFGGILNSVQRGTVPFRIVCLSCKEEIVGSTPRRISAHWRHDLGVDVTSLTEHADEFIKSGDHPATGKLVEDFQLLCDHIEQLQGEVTAPADR